MNSLPPNLPKTPQNLLAFRDSPAQRSHQKYRNQKITDPDGTTFDSKAEYRHWCHLLLLQKAGEITELKRQVPFELVPAQVAPDGTKMRATTYIADFTYRNKKGEFIVDDPKGASTPEWRIKRKLMLHVHGIWVREVRE